MVSDYINNSRHSHMDIGNNKNQSSSSIFTSNRLDSILKNESQKKLKRINILKDFFCNEKDQVETIIRVIWYMKKQNPFGITLQKICKVLEYYDKYYLFKNNVYLLSLLNTLSIPYVGILQINMIDSSFDLTAFGKDFLDEMNKK